jgi:hypothetical protein
MMQARTNDDGDGCGSAGTIGAENEENEDELNSICVQANQQKRADMPSLLQVERMSLQDVQADDEENDSNGGDEDEENQSRENQDNQDNKNNKATTTRTATRAASSSSRRSSKKTLQQSNRAVLLCIRRVLAAVLVLSAIAVSVSVYRYISLQEEHEFTAQFDSDAQKILSDIGTNFDLTMGAADAFMLRLVAHAHATHATWPMVPPLPDLAVQSAKLLSQTNSIYMAFYPLVVAGSSGEHQTRAAWENFTRYNDAWVDEALRVQANNPNFHGTVVEGYNYTRSYSIWTNQGLEPPDAEGPVSLF